MNRSPLHGVNARHGARFVDFGGWEMPVQFDTVLGEHRAVRETAGIFDVSHLGRFRLTGPGSRAAIHGLLTNELDRITPGRTQYTLMLNESGGVVDDLIVWWWNDEEFWLLPNAANHERVMSSFAAQQGCLVEDLRPSTALIAVQGPDAPRVLESVIGTAPLRFRTVSISHDIWDVHMAGTGYTGEKGGEICIANGGSETIYMSLHGAGARLCGLGARDTLRLEAGLALWGEDIDETTTPIEAGLGFAVRDDLSFVGGSALRDQIESGPERKLTGFVLTERGIPRHGHRVRGQGATGTVTSGNLSPTLDIGVGLAYMTPPQSPGTAIEVEIRNRWVPGRITEPPFHKS